MPKTMKEAHWQWKGREIDDISVYFTCLCYPLDCFFTRDIDSMHQCAGFHSFTRSSSWSNSHLNNIHCNKTGQTHRHRVTDKKHFHFKYNKICYTRWRGILLEMRTMKHLGSFPWNATRYRHTTQTQFRQKQRNQLRVKEVDLRPSLMYFKKNAIHWRSGSQANCISKKTVIR